MSILNTWQFNLVFFYVFVVIYYQCYKLAIKTVKNDGAAAILLQLIAGISILSLVPLFSFTWPSTAKTVMLLVAACVFYAINDRLQMTARKHLEVSTFSVVNQLSTIFLIIFGITIFREPIVLQKLLGGAVILAANVLVFYQPKKKKFEINKFSFLAICSTFAFATAISIDINISQSFNLPFYISLTLVIPSLFIAVSEKVRLTDVIREFQRGHKGLFLLAGIAWSLCILFSLRAFKFGKVSTIVPLEAAAVIMNVLAAYLFLGERSHPYKKIAGAILVVLGVYFTVK